ncbi:MAG TPA: hypothetical protein DD471_09205 [Planctomycetes bacterium]|nr:hypothetical protein [Planctomycetota bacterium]
MNRKTAHSGIGFRALAAYCLLCAFAVVVCCEEGEKPDLTKLAPGVTGKVDFKSQVEPLLLRCVRCHGEEKAKGGLRLHRREELLAGGDNGAVVISGDSAGSRLVHAVAALGKLVMPPGKKDRRLTAAEIGVLRGWIDQGLSWPGDRQLGGKGASSAGLWAFRPVKKTEPPVAEGDSWSRNPIDRFILSRMKMEGLAPSPEADRYTLIRRLSLDLTGLLPKPEQVRRFVEDKSAEAWEDLVRRMLRSPHFGERWGRYWLDLARYADSDGYEKDGVRPFAWRYRDWVIRALNQDLPYDQFVVHQLAGDLLPSPTGKGGYPDGVIATGVLAMGNYDDQESNKEQLYAEVIDDQIDLVSRQFLGLTISCARCHDHKFDPISTADYYSLGGIFLSSRVLETKNRIGAHRLKISLVSPEGKKQGTAIGIQEGGYSNSRHKKIGDMPIYIRGDPSKLGPVTPRRFPQVLAGDRQEPIGQRTGQSGRLELARWIANPNNPLTARVMVNRIWQFHFGRGLVRTPNNFGSRGGRPSHPQLLDYLADRFVKSRWSLKSMHRLVMNSATYQQDSAKTSSRQRRVDPDNVFLGRFSTRRLTAEELHDSLQAVSGRPGKRAVYTRVGHEYVTLGASLFDGPATGTIVPIRTESTTAPQGLYMMNDEFVVSASRSLAEQLAKRSDSDELQIRLAYELVYGRVAGLREIEAGRAFLATRPADQRWVYFQVLLCSNEFMYLD